MHSKKFCVLFVCIMLVYGCARTVARPKQKINDEAKINFSPPLTTTPPTISPELLQQKSLGAREFLKSIPVKEFSCTIKVRKKKQKLKGREIALVFLDPATRKNHYAKIGICFSRPQETLTVLDGNLPVRWLRGKGITHFAFEARQDNVRLILLDGKHWMIETRRGEYYFPYTDDFLFMEFVAEGAQFLLAQIRKTQEELCALEVRSRAFPPKKLCEVFPDDYLFNIALIEQMDEDEFRDACPQLETMSPQNGIFQNCAEYSVFKVLIHYTCNKYDAFRYVGSRAGAIGAMQFTKKTYRDVVIKQCPEAQLIRDFETGARDLKNSIKAAICLLDLELSRMPPLIKHMFEESYRLAGIYPAGAYNGGSARARCLYTNDRKTRKCKATTTAWKETTGYIAKYHGIWYIIDHLVSLLKQQPTNKPPS